MSHAICAAKTSAHAGVRAHDLDAEVARVSALGATVLTPEPVREFGWSWHVLADPDGNEFCVLQPSPEYWDPPAVAAPTGP